MTIIKFIQMCADYKKYRLKDVIVSLIYYKQLIRFIKMTGALK